MRAKSNSISSFTKKRNAEGSMMEPIQEENKSNTSIKKKWFEYSNTEAQKGMI
jgi:hypothetical protein